jgi:hypothetical protein
MIKRINRNQKIINSFLSKKFLGVLDKILERIKKEFSFRYKLNISLNFKINAIENEKYKIECISTAYIPNEKPCECRDDNILEKELTNGLNYLINEVNNEAYKDLKYED